VDVAKKWGQAALSTRRAETVASPEVVGALGQSSLSPFFRDFRQS